MNMTPQISVDANSNPATPVRHSSTLLSWTAWVIAGFVLTQGVTAGLFLGGQPPARMAHLILGSLLPWLTLVVIPIAIIERRAGRCSRGLAIAAGVLPVLLLAQDFLGHIPFPVTTAIHVPLGIVLLTYSVVVALAARKP